MAKLLLCCLLLGCSSPTTPADGGKTDASLEAGTSDSAMPDAGCTAIDLNKYPTRQDYTSPDTPPMPMGGTIAPGTYALTKSTLYDGTTKGPLPNGQWVEVFGTTSYEVAEWVALDPSFVVRETGTWETNGHVLSKHVTCPSKAELVADYTATASSIVLVTKENGFVATYEFTKQ